MERGLDQQISRTFFTTESETLFSIIPPFLADRTLVKIELLEWLSSVRLSATDVLWLNGAR